MAQVQKQKISVTEREGLRKAKAYRRAESERDEAYAGLVEWMRDANAEGLSYDRIVAITGLSKTQVQRIILAEG